METDDRDTAMMRSFIREKRKERSDHLTWLLATARKEFNMIVDMIKTSYNPEKIYQWGSLVTGESFQEISDIDIAVSGITDPEIFFKLCTEAERLASFPVHIVQLETIHPSYARDIVEKGVLIYERPVQ